MILVSQLYLTADSFAGPPLVIDDPGILDPGAWEVIFGFSIEDRPVGKSGFEPANRLDHTFYIGLQWFTGG